MKLTQKNIEEYIDRFMEGETTNDEERAIYRFFREEKVPVHLQEYAPMFAWYEGGMQEETVITKKRFHLPIEVWSIGIAATITIVLGFGVLMYEGGKENMPEEWVCYEGSYMEVNGKRITDVELIMPAILETLSKAEYIERMTKKRLEMIRLSEEEIQAKEKLVNY